MLVARSVFRRLLKAPGDRELMLKLAVTLGDSPLGNAYCWAAERGLWPFMRSMRKYNCCYQGVRCDRRVPPEYKVYDWDRVGRPLDLKITLPESCKLPVEVYRAIVKLPNKRYGGVNRAFVLLSRVLDGCYEADACTIVGQKEC